MFIRDGSEDSRRLVMPLWGKVFAGCGDSPKPLKKEKVPEKEREESFERKTTKYLGIKKKFEAVSSFSKGVHLACCWKRGGKVNQKRRQFDGGGRVQSFGGRLTFSPPKRRTKYGGGKERGTASSRGSGTHANVAKGKVKTCHPSAALS